MCFVGVHGGVVSMGHGFKGLVLVVKGGFSVYVHNVRHRVDGGPHGVSGDASIIKVSYPLWRYEVPFFVGDSGVGSAAVVVGFEPIGTGVHVIQYLELLPDMVFKILDAGSFLVLFSEVANISFLEGGHQATYDASEHIHGKSCKLFSTHRGGAW